MRTQRIKIDERHGKSLKTPRQKFENITTNVLFDVLPGKNGASCGHQATRMRIRGKFLLLVFENELSGRSVLTDYIAVVGFEEVFKLQIWTKSQK